MTAELGARPTTPRSCDHDNRLRRYRDTQDRGETGTGGTTATILVVDDEPDLEKLVTRKFRRQIREQLISFVFARDGLEALQSIEQHPHVDLVVLDINMPRMDGLSLLAKLQEREDKKSAIIVSAYGDMRNIRTAMNRGAFDFLTKPIDFADLEATIQKTIRHIEVLRDARRRQSEAERAHASLSRYFSPELAKRLAAGASGADEFRGRPIGDLILRGRSEPLRAHEPLSAAEFDASTTTQYATAFTQLESDDAAAMRAFAALVGTHADDRLASYHLRRLLNGAKGVRIQVG